MTTTFSKWYPELITEFGHGRMLDMRCGFAKSFLNDKFDEKIHASQIWFRGDN